ncbi:hypothetical protein MFMK1_001842 [Metallumcola ferriviriculae]|uniref:RND related barrel-sandwich hybrid domain-containing protein n=1 Tax=Metallumcola ferriviriculae TaxID=3039180 RepID=A0AAU0UP72_9FIRM|nr:hypothetical protein MFMK1_001842 [Desulfitibacteraceae bacterium MK1]
MKRGKRNQEQKRRRKFAWAVIFIVIAVFTLFHATEIVERYMIDLKPVQNGALEESIQVEALVFAEGENLPSPASGQVNYLVKDGMRIPVGTAVAEVQAAGFDVNGMSKVFTVKTPIAGVINLSTDISAVPANTKLINQMDLEKLMTLRTAGTRDNDRVSRGEVIARVVNNLRPVFLAIELTSGFYPTLKVGDSLAVKGTGLVQSAVIKRLENSNGRRLALLEAPAGVADGKTRLNVIVQGRKYTGIILPEAALVIKGGKTGVFQARDGNLQWVPVEVIGRLNEQVAVKGLQPNMRVASNAGKILQKK